MFLLYSKVIIELVTYWDEGFGRFNWVIWKNIIVTIFGILALVFGSKDAIHGIVQLYTPAAHTFTNTTVSTTLAAVATTAVPVIS